MFINWEFWSVRINKLSKLKYYSNGNIRTATIIEYSILAWKDK